MSPNNSETGMQLPPPVVAEQAPAAQTAEAGPASVAEQAPGLAEKAPMPQNAAATAAMPPLVLPLPTQNPPVTGPTNVQTTTSTAAGTVADDKDLIEKEWVNKAKQIVDRTRDDPYKQSEELTLVKVDYMKKRYGKTLKLNK